ncbi:YeeE/YedE family protein [Oceanibaculum pacificum]|uniref:Uncharacterized protein n=1 Tax=Oceanibaculum pacificum TaxID=580166 RepID=A0A154W1J0_9PROT|nr:YeeE/YedE family protein [Oceanibaculum pacificum]KZD07415.1 hypothetical protein AUP43_02530 [Oceanibaculum pacificum]
MHTLLPYGPAALVLCLIDLAADRLQAGMGATAGFSLLLGAALGIVFQRGRFCFQCIFRDLFDGDGRPAQSIVVALLVGMLGYWLIFSAWLPDPQTGRLPPGAHIGPAGPVVIVGGMVFGLGMGLSGACISGHLYRLGEGSVRAPFALVGALLGFALGFWSWEPLYTLYVSRAPVRWLPQALGYGGAMALQAALLLAVALFLDRRRPPDKAALSASSLPRRLLVERWPPVIAGTIVGLIGVAAYFRMEPLGVTRQIGTLARAGAERLDLIPGRLVGLDGLAGCISRAGQLLTDNGLLIGGIVLGSFAAALAAGAFRPARQPPGKLASALFGGVLMGWGAMVSLGCTVGVLLSGIMAFAEAGWLFLVATLIGSYAARILEPSINPLGQQEMTR